ncbi:hypothetical protein ACHAXR_007759 [Thalassiosira sp. AJA248-18]
MRRHTTKEGQGESSKGYPIGSSDKRATSRKSNSKLFKGRRGSITIMLTLVLLAIVLTVQFRVVLRYYSKMTKQNNDNMVYGMSSSAITMMPSPPPPKIDYIMWSKDEAYMRDCQLHHKSNATWGKIHAPYVDKIDAKRIVEKMHVELLKIIPTLAVLDMQNITTSYSLEFMKSLRQPYIIKSTHLSGGVARVYNNTYHCFKYCMNMEVMPLGPTAYAASLQQWIEDMELDYSTLGGELQYRYITPRIIFEEDVISGEKTNTDVTFWWLSNGHPVFVSEQCERPTGAEQGFQMNRTFLGTDHRRLPIVFNRGTCKTSPIKPPSWNTQLEIMKQVGRHFLGEVVRVDVYGGGEEVWFSELTFTTAGCWKRFKPAVADGLLYGLMKNRIPPEFVTPASVQRMLNDRSWVSVSLDYESLSGSFPSPVDLCLTFEEYSTGKQTKEILFNQCIQTLKRIQKHSLRCIVSMNNGTNVRAFGVDEPVNGVSKFAKQNICEAEYLRSKDIWELS